MKKLFLYFVLFVGIFVLCFILANAYFNQKMTEKQGEKMDIAQDSISIEANDEQTEYYVGIRNGRVVVYESDTDQVYEYTEIDADLIERLHPALYQDLLKTVPFDSKKEMYRYLESLSS